jgi:hypothetical protein
VIAVTDFAMRAVVQKEAQKDRHCQREELPRLPGKEERLGLRLYLKA